MGQADRRAEPVRGLSPSRGATGGEWSSLASEPSSVARKEHNVPNTQQCDTVHAMGAHVALAAFSAHAEVATSTLSDEVSSRRQRLAEQMAARDIDAIVIGAEGNTVYFTGYQSTFWSNRSRPFFIVLPRSGTPVVVCHAGEEPSVSIDAIDVEVSAYAEPLLVDRGGRTDIDFHLAGVAELVAVLSRLGVERVAIERGWYFVPTLTFDGYDELGDQLERVDVVDASEAIWAVRHVKSRYEIEKLRSAADALGSAHEAFASVGRPGMSEREIARMLQECALAAGGEKVPYVGVVAGTERAPLGGPTDRQWRAEDLLGVDLTLTVDGYHADFCRVYAGQKPSREQTAAYADLVKALKRGKSAIQPGSTVADVALAMLDGAEAAYSRVGHGLGVDVTESPSLTPHDSTPLVSGMVLCLEPNGSWRDAGWLCSEEEIVVTDDGYDLLSPVFDPELRVLS